MTNQMGVFAMMRVAEKLRATADALEAASSQQQVTQIFSRLRYSARGWHEWSASTEGVTVVDRRDEWRAKFNTRVKRCRSPAPQGARSKEL